MKESLGIETVERWGVLPSTTERPEGHRVHILMTDEVVQKRGGVWRVVGIIK